MSEMWDEGAELHLEGVEQGWDKERKRERGRGRGVSRENMLCFMNNTHTALTPAAQAVTAFHIRPGARGA